MYLDWGMGRDPFPLVGLLRGQYFFFYNIPVFKDNKRGANPPVEFASLSDKEKSKHIPKEFLEKFQFKNEI